MNRSKPCWRKDWPVDLPRASFDPHPFGSKLRLSRREAPAASRLGRGGPLLAPLARRAGQLCVADNLVRYAVATDN